MTYSVKNSYSAMGLLISCEFDSSDAQNVIKQIQELCGISPAPDTERDKLTVSLSDRIDAITTELKSKHEWMRDIERDIAEQLKRIQNNEIKMTQGSQSIQKTTDRLGERLEAVEKHLDDLIKAFDVHVEIGSGNERTIDLRRDMDSLEHRSVTRYQWMRKQFGDLKDAFNELQPCPEIQELTFEPDTRLDRIEEKLDYIGNTMTGKYHAKFYPGVER